MVINTDLRLLFQSLHALLDEETILHLANSDGHFIIHDLPEETFGFDFDRAPSFTDYYEFTAEELVIRNPQVFKHNNRLNFIHPLSYPRPDYHLYSIVFKDQKVLLASYYTWITNSLLIIGILVILFSLAAFIYMRRQSIELGVITDKLKTFPTHPDKEIDLPTKRKDEIGVLARSFQEMAKLIQDNINSLDNARKEAENAVKEKTEFIENMSHEIRNPLQAISGLCEIIKKNEPAKHQLKLISSLEFNTLNLQNLVNDLLDYKKLLRNQFSLNPEWVNLDTLVQNVYGSHHYFAVSRHIVFQYTIDDKLKNKDIYIDPVRINQILHNLIVNALKYTPSGGNIQFTVAVTAQRKSKQILEFKVQDNGAGLDKKTLENIQKRYFTKGQNYDSSFGLGLTIVQQLLQSMNSKLEVTSKAGEGSTFSFLLELKMKKAEQVVEAKNNQKEHYNQIADSLLIIEDDEQVLHLYKHLFSPLIPRIEICTKIDALSSLQQKFDIILTDIKISNQLIYEKAQLLKTFVSETGLIYVISAIKPKDSFCQDIGIQEFFQKPVNTKHLLSKLQEDRNVVEFGAPNFHSLKEDYDHNLVKVRKAISLLLTEWQNARSDFPFHFDQKKKEAFDLLVHKIITSMRRLELDKFESLLIKCSTEFDQEEINQKNKISVIRAMDYYLSVIKHELEISL
jgi:signal transduction histidine kinase/CheY-like chemotaxis protein